MVGLLKEGIPLVEQRSNDFSVLSVMSTSPSVPATSPPDCGDGCCSDAALIARGYFDLEILSETARYTRRRLLQGAIGLTLGATLPGFWSHRVKARTAQTIQLAFCGQLLCVVPYEVASYEGFFKDEGLDVELIYTRGGGAALQALVGGAVDYAATSFDAAVQAYARTPIFARYASTGRLPLFALAVSPRFAGTITKPADLVGRTVGVSALGNADHTLVLYLLSEAGIDTRRVEFATLGTNLFEALNRGHVPVGMVQEPALSLLEEAGGRTLVNFMNLDDTERYFGGAYEFMGIAFRKEERERRLDEMRRIARAMEKALQHVHEQPGERLIKALPRELVAGGDENQLIDILDRYRHSLFPTSTRIDVGSCERVVQSQQVAGLLHDDFDLAGMLDLDVLH